MLGRPGQGTHFGARPTVSCEIVAKMSPGLVGPASRLCTAPQEAAALADQGVGNVASRTSIAWMRSMGHGGWEVTAIQRVLGHGGFNIQGHFFHLGDKYHRKWNKHEHL